MLQIYARLRKLLTALPLMAGLLLTALPAEAQKHPAPLPLPATAAELCLIPTPQQATLTAGALTLPPQGLSHLFTEGDTSSAAAVAELLSARALLNPACTTAASREPSRAQRKLQKDKEPYLMLQRVDTLPVAANSREAYRLDITPQRILIQYTATEGSLMACYTLAQLHEAYGDTLPGLRITDWPAYAWRGWMDDISRGPVPTAHYMQKEAAILSLYKMNFFNFYTEHTLRNPHYPDVAPGDGLSGGEIAALLPAADGTAAGQPRGTMQAMANLQCLAHAEKTLRIPFYHHLMDGPHNFDPSNEATYRYLQEILSYAADTAYRDCRFFNINCDETEGLGSGHAKDYVTRMGSDEAYCQHIRRVCELLKPYGKQVLMWGDIVAKKPEMIQQLPKEIQYIVWNYAPQESYAQCLAPFRQAHEQQGIALWVAPAVAHYTMMLPNPHSYMQNIACLSRDGLNAGATGLMNTAWDDDGEALFDNTWHGMLWAAEMAWHPIHGGDAAARQELQERERRFNRNVNVLFFQGQSMALLNQDGTAQAPDYQLPEALRGEDFVGMLYRVGTLENDADIAGWCHTASLYEPLYDFYPSRVDSAMAARIVRAQAKLMPLADSLAAMSDLSDYGTHNPLKHALYAVHHMQATALKSQLRRQIYLTLQDSSAANRTACRQLSQQYFDQLYALKKEYLRLWDAESREYSRDGICQRFDALGQEVLEMDRHVFFEMRQDAQGAPQVTMRTLYGDKEIYYTLDGRTPANGSSLYRQPFPIERSGTVKAIAYNGVGEGTATERYLLRHKGMGCPLTLATAYSTYRDTYSGGGDNALTDGQLGSDDGYGDGHWQGYWGCDMDVAIDLKQVTPVDNISIRFLQNTFDWILAPTEIQLYTSPDGQHWTLARRETFAPEFAQGGNIVHTDALRGLALRTRHLRIVVPNPGPLPAWHPSHGQPSYLFADEIVVE